jgi:hypothetical protein
MQHAHCGECRRYLGDDLFPVTKDQNAPAALHRGRNDEAKHDRLAAAGGQLIAEVTCACAVGLAHAHHVQSLVWTKNDADGLRIGGRRILFLMGFTEVRALIILPGVSLGRKRSALPHLGRRVLRWNQLGRRCCRQLATVLCPGESGLEVVKRPLAPLFRDRWPLVPGRQTHL